MATNKRLSKEEKAARELQLVEATFHGITTPHEHHAKAWALRCAELQKGLSKTAVKRAQKLAHDRAADVPPGYVTAMECFGIFDEVCERMNISKADAETMWGAVAKICMYELSARQGEFHQAAAEFGLVAAERQLPSPIQVIAVAAPARPCGNPNCRNCSPRRAEELN